MKSISKDKVSTELLGRIRHDFARYYGLPTEPTVLAAWEIVNPYSLVLCIKFGNANWSRRVFVKLPLGPFDPVTAAKASQPEFSYARIEFDALSSVAHLRVVDPILGTASSVVPLAYYLDLFALVTLEAVGPTLRRLYNRNARKWALPGMRQSLLDRVALSGKWLRLFHDSSTIGLNGFPLEEFLNYCTTRLNKLSQTFPSFLSWSEAEALIVAVKKVASKVPVNSLRISGCHNDFASHNIIAVEDGGISILDFTMYGQGVNAFDVCNFWFELEMLKCDPTNSIALLSDAQSVFLTGYGALSTKSPDFMLARFRYSINRLLNIASNTRKISYLSPNWHRSITLIRGWLRVFATSH